MELGTARIRVDSNASQSPIPNDGMSRRELDPATELTNKLSSLAKAIDTTRENQMILDSLWFSDLKERQANIAASHDATFKWVLDESSAFELKNWLRSQRGIYWVRGRAGSGKSTLMKFLVNHPHTVEALTTWAGTRRLVTGSFFFWNAGSLMQKSQEGLLTSLLYEILRQCPELIHSVCKSKVETIRSSLSGTPPSRYRWTREGLWEAIEGLRLQSEVNAQFCFFIDGLDEYEGEPDQIVKVLSSLHHWPNIKLCVSCRPWNEFLDAFDPGVDLHIALEDLTQDDIRLYIQDSLEGSARFRALKARDSRSQDLVQEIVEKARGVFLWVVLVVRSLLTGLTNADKISRLQARLHNFPETLEKFFGHMLRAVEMCYREETALIFKYGSRRTSFLNDLFFP